jgi:hypothetical protein
MSFTFKEVYNDKIDALLFTVETTGYANTKIQAKLASTSTTPEIIIDLLKIQLIGLIYFREV